MWQVGTCHVKRRLQPCERGTICRPPGRRRCCNGFFGPFRRGRLAMLALFFILFIGLEVKHYIADYFLQPAWMLVGKGDLRHPGGYAHAAVHAALSAIVLLIAGTPLPI